MTGRMVMCQLDMTLASDATQDIWSLLGAADSPIILHGWELTSSAVAAALIDINLHRISAVGSGGAALSVEELLDERFSAVTAGVRTEDTTKGTDAGSLMSYQWEQLGPVGHVFTPEMRPVAKEGEGFALSMNTAATPTLSGWICWEELGP